jgi:hypothetical protein
LSFVFSSRHFHVIVSFDVGTFFTYLDAHGFGLTLSSGSADLTYCFALESNLLRSSRSRHLTVATAKKSEELDFLLLTDGLIVRFFAKACLPELYQ